MTKCETCDGTGKIEVNQDMSGDVEDAWEFVDCPDCLGGKIREAVAAILCQKDIDVGVRISSTSTFVDFHINGQYAGDAQVFLKDGKPFLKVFAPNGHVGQEYWEIELHPCGDQRGFWNNRSSMFEQNNFDWKN